MLEECIPSNPIVQATIIVVLGLILRETLLFFFFKRVDEYASLKGEIVETMVFYRNVYSDIGGALFHSASEELRRCAAKIYAFKHKRHKLLFLWGIPDRKDLSDAADFLIFLSNGRSAVQSGQPIADATDKIKALLKLDFD